MFNIRPFYVLLAILLCCITTTEQSIPKRVPMIAVVTGGHRSDVNIKASTQPADKGTRNIVMRVTPHQKMINEFRNILAVRVYLNTLCRRRTLYAVRSLVDTIGLNWNKPVKGYSLINRELLLSLNDPRKTLFIIRFFYAERYVGYGFTFILYGYTKRGNKLQNREISIVWLQKPMPVADGIFQQTVSKSDGCMIAGFPVLIPKGDKYKLVIKGFIGKAYIDVISSLLEVQFKVKNEKGWSWLGRIATVRINPIKPDRRFPNLQYRAALRNVRGILNHPYSVYASMTFTDVKQTIGHTFAVTFVGRRKDNRRGWARHVEISCELKRKPKPPPTTRPPPPAPRPRPRPLPPAPKPRPRPPPPAPRPRPPLPAPRPRPRPPPAPRPRPPLPAPRPRPRPQPPALRPWPRPPPPPAPRPRPPPPAPRPRPRPPPPAPRPRPPPPPAPRPRPPPPAPRPRPPPPAPRPRPQPPPPAPERKPKPPPPTRPPPPPRPRPPPPAPKPRPRPPPPAPRPRPPPPAPRPRPPPPAPRPRPPPAPRPRPRPPPPAPQPRPRPPPPKPQPRPIEPPRIIRPPPAPVRPPPRPRPVQPSTGGRINPKDDEDDEEEEEEEEEDKVSVDVKKNQSEEKSENSGMVAIAGVIVGLLIIVLIVGGLYTMKSNSQDKK